MGGDPGQIKETNMDEKIAVLTDTNSGITPEQAARYEAAGLDFWRQYD